MKHLINTIFVAGLAAVLSSCATREASRSASNPAYYYAETNAGPVWPCTIVEGPTTTIIYEPQADAWDGHLLTARDAVGVQSAGQPVPTYGVVTFHAITLVDKTKRTVSLEQIRLVDGDFPSARQENQNYLKTLRETFPKHLEGLLLDRLEASFAVAPQLGNGSAQRLNNAAPKIIFSTRPAILAYVDGPPVYRPVPGTELQRVINSRLLFLRCSTGRFYLHLWDGYMTSPSLEGPWLVASKPPKGAADAEKHAMASPTPADLLNGQTGAPTNQRPRLTSATAPVIYVATTPTELILFDGQPNFVPIAGTHLLYVANTTANVFKLLTDQLTYLLISGRWFRAPSLGGPWQFVPAARLAPDFANIPDTSPKENVKASVPGTPQATEALIANCIPEGAKVPLNMQMRNPQIDGTPRLQAIAGTPLYYVVNSGTPIIMVNEDLWYACQNGIWYAAPSVNGPWTVATSVPGVIYTIPPSSPLHYLTYVQVYGATPQEVYEGYTPGYWGTEVEDGVVVYGTGYDYPPWIGEDWYGWPCTWGWGWGPCWTPWDDWCFDFGFGWGCGYGLFGWGYCYPPRPWWGPNRNWYREAGSTAWRQGGTVNTAGNLYGWQGSRGGVGTGSLTGAAARTSYARAYNSRTGALAAGQRSSVANVESRLQTRREIGSWGNRALNARTGTRPSVPQYSLRSGFSKVGGGTSTRSFRKPSIWGRVFASGWGGYSHGGGHARGFVGGGGHAHGGWGGGSGHGGGGGHR